MFGVPRKRALGRTFDRFFPAGAAHEAREMLLKTSSGRPRRRTAVATRNDGSLLIVEGVCAAVPGIEEETSAYVVVLRDVTEPLLVRSATSAVAFEADASAALESFSQVLRQVIPVDNLTLTAVDGEGARRVASGGRCAKRLPSGETIPLDGTPLGAAVARRRPLVCVDTRAGDLPYDAVLAQQGVRSYVVLPLFHRGRVVATLNVGFATVDAPTAAVVRLLGSLTASIMPIVLNLVTLEEQEGVIQRLEQLDALKNEFLALITHDIRTPVAVIAGFAEQLQKGWDELPEAEKLESVDAILRNGRKLYRLVEEGLQVARIEAGQFAFELRPVALAEEVERTVADLAPADADRIRVTVRRGLPLVLCDPHRHWQILTNLLSNALKFSPPETTIHVDLTRRGPMVQVAVRDHGPGIERADLPKLFQKFARIGGPEQRSEAGTGLGLYIAKALVEAQEGVSGCAARPAAGRRSPTRFLSPSRPSPEGSSSAFEEPISMRVGDRLRAAVDVELGQDPLDVRRDGLRRDEERLGDLLLTEAIGEQVQDLELARRQVGPGEHMRGRRPVDHSAHARDELAVRKRLHDVVIGAEEHAGRPVEFLRSLAGQEDDGDVVPKVVTQPPEDLVPRDVGEVHVEEHYRRPVASRHRQRRPRGRRLVDDVAERLEQPRHEPTEGPVVVDDKDDLPLLCPRHACPR